MITTISLPCSDETQKGVAVPVWQGKTTVRITNFRPPMSHFTAGPSRSETSFTIVMNFGTIHIDVQREIWVMVIDHLQFRHDKTNNKIPTCC